MPPAARRMVRIASIVVIALALLSFTALAKQKKTVQAALEKAHSECTANMAAAAAAKTEAEPPPNPEPTTVALFAPGTSGPVSLKRAYVRGHKFVADVEGVTMSNVASANGTVTATLAVAPGLGPNFVHLRALHPIDCSWDIVPMAFINTVYRFDLKGANGWTIRAVPSAKTFRADAKDATLEYTVEFLRGAETKPFETRPGKMTYYGDKDEQDRLDVDIYEPESTAKKDLEEITKKMADPNLTDAQRDALGQRYAKAMQQMNAELMALMTDPNAAQKKVDDFGCRMIQFYPDGTGKGTGSLSCGKNVGKEGVVNFTGTVTVVK